MLLKNLSNISIKSNVHNNNNNNNNPNINNQYTANQNYSYFDNIIAFITNLINNNIQYNQLLPPCLPSTTTQYQ